VEDFVVVLRNDIARLLISRMVDVACVGGTTRKGIANEKMKLSIWKENNVKGGGNV
jgi:hypothetical protein